MNYEIAKKLKEAGFPQNSSDWFNSKGKYCNPADEICECSEPTLSELIEACGDKFVLVKNHNHWHACKEIEDHPDGYTLSSYDNEGSTPEEAVANLWLELNK